MTLPSCPPRLSQVDRPSAAWLEHCSPPVAKAASTPPRSRRSSAGPPARRRRPHRPGPALSEREARVVSMRFGLTDGQPKTLDEIGKVYGVTRERIRQIESKTMSKLRHPSRSQVLRDYLDLSRPGHAGVAGPGPRDHRPGPAVSAARASARVAASQLGRDLPLHDPAPSLMCGILGRWTSRIVPLAPVAPPSPAVS